MTSKHRICLSDDGALVFDTDPRAGGLVCGVGGEIPDHLQEAYLELTNENAPEPVVEVPPLRLELGGATFEYDAENAVFKVIDGDRRIGVDRLNKGDVLEILSAAGVEVVEGANKADAVAVLIQTLNERSVPPEPTTHEGQ